MRQLVSLYALVLSASALAMRGLGYEAAMLLAYGTIALMALMISATFLWLWQLRATPLALGMSLSWAGSGLTIGWWWLLEIADHPAWGQEAAALFVVLSILICGAVLHFAVIQGTFGLRGGAFLVPVLAAALVSFGVVLLL
ncbi:hypothetical protein [Celeribacter indicus]|uniref:Uncharacterized protein n=1 Tax=Celeribacter indicus TaxID=1208324 RepID=A0A0B5DZY3_9RHOB|nr:hypothetical protein [Celeribacter indicus]AJE46296.1 hypothetical protein P73_1581 [Celeribacter indicus]SDW52559.1 hypothetical protein SAMN05443573_104132 [Celeribacter indicus]